MAAVIHIAAWAAVVSVPKRLGVSDTYLLRPTNQERYPDTCRTTAKAPSNPIHTYCVGRMALASGMAVIVLAARLRIMHISGAHGR